MENQIYTNYCKVFRETAAYVKNWISKQPAVGEESITDWFLFNISENLPHIKYKQFTRYAEGKTTGADWEWWFIFSDKKSFVTRVQAKKLRADKNNYPGLAHTTQGRMQINKLINNAQRNGMASFYAFYSDSESEHLCDLNNSKSSIFLCEANKIKKDFIDSGRVKVFDNQLLAISTPIECLFCSHQFSQNPDKAEVFNSYLDSYFPIYGGQTKRLGFQNTPDYVKRFLEQGLEPDWFDQENRGIKGILMVDLRSQDISGII